jgi:hypothetical protein
MGNRRRIPTFLNSSNDVRFNVSGSMWLSVKKYWEQQVELYQVGGHISKSLHLLGYIGEA